VGGSPESGKNVLAAVVAYNGLAYVQELVQEHIAERVEIVTVSMSAPDQLKMTVKEPLSVLRMKERTGLQTATPPPSG